MGWNAIDITKHIGAPLADGQPMGYVFEAQGTQHVIYNDFDAAQGSRGHIHELWWEPGGSTHHKDLTDTADAPLAGSFPTGYVFASERTQHVIYQQRTLPFGSGGHIHELWWENGDPNHNNLTANAGVPPSALALPSVPTGYAFEAERTQHVFYSGVDNHLHELWWRSGSTPHHGVLTAVTGDPPAPLALGSPSAYVFKAQRTQHVVYQGTDKHIHEFWWTIGGPTHHNPLTARIGAPLAGGQPIGYIFDAQGTQHVVYVGEDQHIHELWWDSNWHHNDLTAATGAPLARLNGIPTGYVFDAQGTQHVVYESEGHIHELWWDSSGWHYDKDHNDLTAVTGAPAALSNPSGYVFAAQGTQHVIYNSIDHHIVELYWVP
jgi:hypothetical protein